MGCSMTANRFQAYTLDPKLLILRALQGLSAITRVKPGSLDL